MILFPNCKINLGLHIVQKRKDGYHDLETIFYPIPLTDALEIIQHTEDAIDLQVSGLAIDTPPEQNICYKAYQVLKKDFPQLPPVRIHLHKTIPSGAGLGGGSADGAFTLLLLNKKFRLGLSEVELLKYALQLGSDCPFFIINQPCFATGRGEKMEPVDLNLSAYQIVLVNPGINVSTPWAFSKIKPLSGRPSIKQLIQQPVSEWKTSLKNDFEAPVFEAWPELQSIREQLYAKGALYAAMTGSGSTLFGIFERSTVPSFEFPPHYFISS
jgi:4-diphosphocytidyl-2-C-methyl-D-erythritol kinase